MLTVTRKMKEEAKKLRETTATRFSYPAGNGYVEGYTSNHDTVGVVLVNHPGDLDYRDFVVIDGYDF